MTNSIQDRPTESLHNTEIVLKDAQSPAEETAQATADGVDATGQSWTAQVIRFLKTLKQQIVSQWQARMANRQEHYAYWKNQAEVVDEKLKERYGDRYTTVKEAAQQTIQEKATVVTTWYTTVVNDQDLPIADVLHQKQAELETKLNQAETFITKQEQKVRQQLKDLLQTTAAKL